ncbi:MAG TPA: FecR domain-containing protein [Steroidobacteraceae bacterium]
MNRQINEEAARWFVEFRSRDIDEGGRRAFDAWMRASPEHLRAFVEIAALWGHSGALELHGRFSMEELIASAREEAKVISLSRTPRPARFTERRRMWLAAASVLVLVAGSLITWSALRERQTYSTEVGEQRSLRLTDGSTVALNSRSRARIRFSDATRTVDLLEGEALFRVAQDATRPFIVRAKGTVVRAVGTEFDVDQRSRGAVVTVLEGRVAVLTAGVQLSAGEQIDTSVASTRATRANVGSATAWTQGRVILQSATLEQVAERFSRYSQRRLSAEDHGQIPFHLSGVFSTDPDFLIRYLRERPDIQVRESATEIRIIRGGVD